MKPLPGGPGRWRRPAVFAAGGLALAALAVALFQPRPAPVEREPDRPAVVQAPSTKPAPIVQPKKERAPERPPRPKPAPVPPPPAPRPEAPAVALPPEAPPVEPAPPAAGSGPVLIARARLERGSAGLVLRLDGEVGDSAESPNTAASIRSITWQMAGTELFGSLSARADRRFELVLPAEDLPERIEIGLQVATSDGRSAERSLKLLVDRRPPKLVLLEPAGGEAYYGRRVVVRGRIGDPDDELDRPADLAPLAWEIPGTGLKGEAAPAADGQFSIEIPTAGQSDRLTVGLRAEDRLGNRSRRELVLRNDLTGPLIEISAPAQRGYYGGELVVKGRVSDQALADTMPDAVKSFGFRLLGSPDAGGSLQFDRTGGFELRLPAGRLTGLQAVLFQAEDWCGNASRSLLFLRPAPDRAADAAVLTPLPDPNSIVIDEPAGESFYRSRVVVNGRVSPAAGAALDWRVAGSDRRGLGGLHRDGSFEFECPTAGLRGPQLVVLRVKDAQGRLSEEGLVLFERPDGPHIIVNEPAEDAFYGPRLTVRGTVSNSMEEPDSASELVRLGWEIENVQASGRELSFDFDGAFAFDIATTTWSGTRTLILAAEDRNGHVTRMPLRLLDPNLKPSLAVSAPQPGSAYGARIRLLGRISAPYADLGINPEIVSLGLEIRRGGDARSAPLLKRGLELRPDGSFSAGIDAAQFKGPIQLSLNAETLEGEAIETALALVHGEGDIPSFAARSGDGRVELRWESVAGAAGYRIHGRPSGAEAEQSGPLLEAGAESFSVLGLENGRRYEFRLQAVGEPGVPELWSAVVAGLPLAEDTLKPELSGEYRRIRVRWKRLTGVDAYEVWRAAEGRNEFEKLAGPVPGSEYNDANVRFGIRYAYRIKPALAGTTMSAPASASTAAFPDRRFEALGTLPLGGVKAVALSGNYALVAAGADGIRIVDVSRPDSPAAVGQLELSDACDLTVKGRLAYVADGAGGLKVVSLENPARPYVLGVRASVDARAVALRGDKVYLADGEGGFKIIDVSAPRQPMRLAGLDLPGARALALAGDLAIVAAGSGGAVLIDIADPANPVRLAVLPGEARSLAVSRDRLYLAGGKRGLEIYGLGDPAQPKLLGRIASAEAETVWPVGDFVLTAGTAGDLRLYDVFDPARPAELDKLRVDGLRAMAVLDDDVCLADGAGLRLARLILRGESIEIGSQTAGGNAVRLSLSGAWIFTANHEQGIAALKLDAAAGLAGKAAMQFAEQVWVSGGRAYVADGEAGLKIVDLSALGSAKAVFELPLLGAVKVEGYAYSVAGSEHRVWIAAGPAGLVELEPAAKPGAAALVALPDARDLARRDSRLFVADSVEGLVVFDCSAPGAPRRIAGAAVPGAKRLALQNGRLAVAGNDGCVLFDVTDPAKPVKLGVYPTGFAEGLCLEGRYLYVAEGHRGLRVIDVSAPARPVEVSACEGMYAVDVAYRDGHAYLADARGVRVIRILIPDWLVR